MVLLVLGSTQGHFSSQPRGCGGVGPQKCGPVSNGSSNAWNQMGTRGLLVGNEIIDLIPYPGLFLKKETLLGMNRSFLGREQNP